MRIGVLGSGLMGSKLGTIFARAGHEVVFSYSRDSKKLEQLAKDAGKRASVGTPAEAVRGADAVLLAVHWKRVDELLGEIGAMSGKLLLSCTLPMSEDDSHLIVGRDTSGAETLAKKVKRAHVVSAFSTVPSEVLFAVFDKRKKETRPDLVYCGDDRKAKKKAAQLIGDAGFEPVDLGELSMARYIEPYSLLMAQRAYGSKDGPAIGYRFERYKERKKLKG